MNVPGQFTFPGKDDAGSPVDNPFAEQLEFFRAKLNLPTERWDDIMNAAHDRAFIVAGAANADLLQDLNSAVRKAIEQGRGLQEFRKDFNALVLKHGWTGWTGEGSKAGQAWRTNIIYQTNMATSYAAGRWKQLTDPALLSLRPYWRYHHMDGVMHPRPLHVSWDGLVLRYDHPFWKTHFPPNGWLCHCWVTAVDQAAYVVAQKAGLAEPPAGWDQVDDKTGAPVGIDKGFDYAPGASAGAPLKALVDAKLVKLDAPIGAAMYDTMRPILQAEQEASFVSFVGGVLANPAPAGRLAVLGAIDPATLGWLAEAVGAVPATAAIAVEDTLIGAIPAFGEALAPAEWAQLPALVAAPGRILFDAASGQLLYLVDLPGTDEALLIAFSVQQQAGAGSNLIGKAARVARQLVDAAIAAAEFEVVR